LYVGFFGEDIPQIGIVMSERPTLPPVDDNSLPVDDNSLPVDDNSLVVSD
jgi:hypothetical protein